MNYKIHYGLDRSDASQYCGIYLIVIGGHTYIGSTKRTIWVRIKEHEKLLRNNRHYNSKMQEWFNISKEISFIVLEYCTEIEVCNREQYYISKYNPDINIVKHVANY